MLDNRYTIETPEAIELHLEPAGFWSRGQAFAVDFVIRFLIYIAFSVVIGTIVGGDSEGAFGLILIVLFLLEWFYPVFFELWSDGATPGKKVFGIKVVSDDGTPVTFAASLLRNLLRVIDFLPLFYTTGIISSILSPSCKRLGDLAAGTMVIYAPRPYKAPVLSADGFRAVPASFDVDDQNAILAFAERLPLLPPQRRQELASIVQPILGESEPDPELALKCLANGIIGVYDNERAQQ